MGIPIPVRRRLIVNRGIEKQVTSPHKIHVPDMWNIVRVERNLPRWYQCCFLANVGQSLIRSKTFINLKLYHYNQEAKRSAIQNCIIKTKTLSSFCEWWSLLYQQYTVIYLIAWWCYIFVEFPIDMTTPYCWNYAWCCAYASVDRIIIGSRNGLATVRCQSIAWANSGLS